MPEDVHIQADTQDEQKGEADNGGRHSLYDYR